MRKPKFNTTNFLEPTPEYVKWWEDGPQAKNIKEWFNADLIFWVNQNKEQCEESKVILHTNHLEDWLALINAPYTLEELKERFINYPKEDFNALMTYLCQSLKEK